VARHVLLYDDDCGFCKWTLGKVLALDRRRALKPLALQDPEADQLLGGLDHDRKMASWHLVSPGGEVQSAGSAIAPLFGLLPGGRPVAAAASRFPRAAERAYRWTAHRRSFFGRRLRLQPSAGDRRRIARHRLGGE
jgi:predicted DCC family thiol-disulfide oxidoreductase YuxK